MKIRIFYLPQLDHPEMYDRKPWKTALWIETKYGNGWMFNGHYKTADEAGDAIKGLNGWW